MTVWDEKINFVIFNSFGSFGLSFMQIQCHFVSKALPKASNADLNAPLLVVTAVDMPPLRFIFQIFFSDK
jgi:hypothetical protein